MNTLAMQKPKHTKKQKRYHMINYSSSLLIYFVITGNCFKGINLRADKEDKGNMKLTVTLTKGIKRTYSIS